MAIPISDFSVTVAWQAELSEGDVVPSDDDLVRAVRAALTHGGRPERSVDVVVVDEDTLSELHERFLGDPTPTDVVTFDLGADRVAEDDPVAGDMRETGPDGEVYISLDMARRVALERGVSLTRELILYAVHGALHLCEFDDREPDARARMRVAEAAVMAQLGFEADTRPHDR